MTVISGMKFNQNEGAIVADEQSSGAIRKYELATKLTVLDNSDKTVKAILGGTGAADFLFDVTQQLPFAIQRSPNPIAEGKSMAYIIAQVMGGVKGQYIDGYLYDKFRLREVDFQIGHVTAQEGSRPIDPSLMQQYHQLIAGQGEISQLINNAFLVLAADKEGLQLYNVSTSLANPVPVARPYESVGIGSDTADSVLYEFFENTPRNERTDVNPLDGIAALLNATDRASARNQNVGGTPLIAIVKNGEVIMPDENHSKLGVEVVKAAKRGFVPGGFVREAIGSLMYVPGTFPLVEAAMWEQAKKLGAKRSLELMLRGYKV